MPILALFERAVRMDARRRTPYTLRLLLLAGTLLMVIAGQIASVSLAAPGKVLFSSLIGLNMLFILVAGMPIFVGCIAEEKEEQMLGLLRMTNLNAGAILLGKSCSRFVMVALIMAAQLPFLLMTITLGGVALGQLSAAVVALTGLLILVASIAVLWSILCRRGSIATFCGFAHLLALFTLPHLVLLPVSLAATSPMLSSDPLLAPWINQASATLTFIASLSPLSHLTAVMATGYSGNPFTPSFAACLVVAAMCFSVAWLLFDRFTRKPTDAAPIRKVTMRKGYLPFMAPDRAWTSAVFWKDFFFDTGGKGAMILKTFAGLVAIAIELESGGLMAAPATTILGLWIMCEISIHASRMFSTEIQQHTLTALYTLPTTLRQVVFEKIKARILAVSPLILAWFVILVSGVVRQPNTWYRLLEPFSAATSLLLVAYVSCYISFRMRWGAWLVALPLVSIVSSMVMGIILALLSPITSSLMASEPFAFMLLMSTATAIGNISLCLIAHFQVRQRLRDSIKTG